ncbi:uncharacterized protein LOC132669038 isoform X5 [Panthera onca]
MCSLPTPPPDDSHETGRSLDQIRRRHRSPPDGQRGSRCELAIVQRRRENTHLVCLLRFPFAPLQTVFSPISTRGRRAPSCAGSPSCLRT